MNWLGHKGSIAILTLSLLLFATLVFAGHGWKEEHDSRMRVDAQTGEQGKVIKELEKRREQAQSDLDEQIAALEKRKKDKVSPSQFIADTSRLIPNLPKPLEVREITAQANLPESPTVQEILVPQEDLQVIRDAQITCEEKSLRLAACSSQQSLMNEELGLTKRQRDEWKTTAKGGSRWHRTLAAAKWFAIGAGAGYAGYSIVHR